MAMVERDGNDWYVTIVATDYVKPVIYATSYRVTEIVRRDSSAAGAPSEDDRVTYDSVTQSWVCGAKYYHTENTPHHTSERAIRKPNVKRGVKVRYYSGEWQKYVSGSWQWAG